MMETLGLLGHGLFVVLTPENLLLCLLGAVFGTLIGVLPGLGPVATISLLMPITFSLDPTGAIIMLSGIYYGAQYGGSTTAILVRHRRVQDGAAGQGGRRAGDCRHRFRRRGLLRHADHCLRRSAACQACAAIYLARILLADGVRPSRRRRAG